MYYFLIFFILFIFFCLFLLIKFSKKKKLDSNIKVIFKNNFLNIKKSNSYKEKIIDFDKLYHKVLLELWYKGTFWDILKSSPKIINNLNLVWELHKFRNKLVHDFNNFEEWILNKKSLEYEKVVLDLLNKV